MKRALLPFLLIVAIAGCSQSMSPELLQQYQNRTLYTCCNIHYESSNVSDANYYVGGTIPIRDAGKDGGERASSRSLLVGPDGRVAAHYDKIHLFDVDIPAKGRAAERYSESATTLAGTRVVAAETPLARIGMTVCYDIRFPALFHRLSVLGTDIIVVPAAFTVPTGEVHWLPLLQARAIESLVYVVAAGQWGEHAGGRKTYGHSLILGPWGELLVELPAGPGVACADLDIIRLTELRQRFPTIQHRREL
jgi:nitrilase